jgi:sucrose-6-phosphate hydrolase SacC (GH32 family)
LQEERTRPLYHLVAPEGRAWPADPNGAIYWKGRYHLHFIFGRDWAHVSSVDMVLKIGNKHMLLCISHLKGCRYYLGEWKDEKFTPEFHARMNWSRAEGQAPGTHGGDFFAPESLLAPDGRHVRLHASPDNTRGIDLVVDPGARTIQLGATTAPFDLRPREDLQVRIFIDRRIIEVFANDRQAIFKQHAYEPGEAGVCLFSEGGNMGVDEIKAWRMAASNPW